MHRSGTIGEAVATSAYLILFRAEHGWSLVHRTGNAAAPPPLHRVPSPHALEGLVRSRYGVVCWHQLLDACFDPDLFPAWLRSLDERGLPRPDRGTLHRRAAVVAATAVEVEGMGAFDTSDGGLPEYPIDPNRRRSGGSVARFTVVAVGLAVLVLGGLFVVAAPHRNSGTTTSSAVAETIDFGLPTDGKDSLRLPVRVTPDHDLVEGQQVVVSGSGFRPNISVGVVICTTAALAEGAGTCDIFRVVALGTTDAEGNVSIPYTVRRRPIIHDQPYDCLQGDIDPRQFEDRVRRGLITGLPASGYQSCLMVIGQVDDYDQSGGWPFALRGQTFVDLPELPATTVATTVPDTTVPDTTVPEATVPETTLPTAAPTPTVPTPSGTQPTGTNPAGTAVG